MKIINFSINLLTEKPIEKDWTDIINYFKTKNIINNINSNINSNIPPELINIVPFITLFNQDTSINIQFCKQKVTLNFSIKDENLEKELKSYFIEENMDTIIFPIFNLIKEFTVNRIWILPIFFYETELWIDILKVKFLKNNINIDSDLSLKYNIIDKTTYWFDVNNLNIIEIWWIIEKWVSKDWILIQKDINNLLDKKNNFTDIDFKNFLIKVLDSIEFSKVKSEII